MVTQITKRDGRKVTFNIEKIANAIFKAAQAVGGHDYDEALEIASKVCELIENNSKSRVPTVEEIENICKIENRLKNINHIFDRLNI